AHGHGDLLQGDACRGAALDDAPVEPFRHRAGNHREDLQTRLSCVRGAHHVRRARLRRGQEDYLARRHRRHLDADQVPVYRVKQHLFERLFAYTRPYRGRMALAVAAMVVYALGDAGQAWLVRPIVDKTLPVGSNLSLIAWGIVGVYLLKGVGSYISSYVMTGVGQRVVMDIRNRLYHHILGQSAA